MQSVFLTGLKQAIQSSLPWGYCSTHPPLWHKVPNVHALGFFFFLPSLLVPLTMYVKELQRDLYTYSARREMGEFIMPRSNGFFQR